TVNVLSTEDVTFTMPKKDTTMPEVKDSNVKVISVGIGAIILFGAILYVVLRRNTKGMKSEDK
ncbi:hypothetical protein NYY86_30350, partial [Acinetobacter baumannii]|nr:hypothetical protein [Acinetobacter baumannii]